MTSPSTTNLAWTMPPSSSPPSLSLTLSPKPTPGPHQILLRISAISLNYRDLMVATHAYPLPAKPSLIPGLDGAGTVEAAGPNSAWAAGDTVLVFSSTWYTGGVANLDFASILGSGTVDGTLQRYMVLDDARAVRAPRNLGVAEAATLGTAGATVVNALFFGPARAKKGDVVLTLGTGGVSCFAIQIASAIGATVIATSSSDEKLEVAKGLGAAHVINYKTTPEWDAEVLRITNGRGVDHVLEVGGAQTIVKSLKSVRAGGLVTVIGALTEGSPVDILPLILMGAKTVRGSMAMSKEMVEELVKIVEKFDIHPVVSKVFEFDEALKAYEALREQQDIGKIVIKGA
ncbi:NAD(P)-binding protein [Mytilinidion resinicola]|uniref:NAD(P)-binding protein n=1 Tax=Mytilinidion resinicola TaxID=574789 RepID=A0A6A6YRL9_9PEZI|nr:NAD(P)-binding protein [Mytilinidion resinicola]KAF2810547.1 NAD(P)-binding protein [Mytilinidion resinicola]